MSKGVPSRKVLRRLAAENRLPKPKWSTRKKAIVVAIILSAILGPVGSFLWWEFSNCPSIAVVPTGTNLSIQPGGHIGYNFTVPKVVTKTIVYMTISADNGVVLYLMTPNQYSGFNSTGTSSSYVWKTSQVTSFSCDSGRYGCSVAPQTAPTVPSVGAYFFVISNPSSSLVAKVAVSRQVEVGSCFSGSSLA